MPITSVQSSNTLPDLASLSTQATRATLAQALNEHCACITLDRAKLKNELAREFEAFAPAVAECPETLFSNTTVFVSTADLDLIKQFIAAHQRITALPGWRLAALSDAPEIAQHASAAQGVLMGYDFHLSARGPQLIEINTNAGGALLNMTLARAAGVLRCC